MISSRLLQISLAVLRPAGGIHRISATPRFSWAAPPTRMNADATSCASPTAAVGRMWAAISHPMNPASDPSTELSESASPSLSPPSPLSSSGVTPRARLEIRTVSATTDGSRTVSATTHGSRTVGAAEGSSTSVGGSARGSGCGRPS
jgi:hypothetical protein